MSEPNLKAMTQAELLKYLDEDFMPRLLPKLANIQNLETENARLKAEVERLISVSEAWKKRRLDKVEDECIKWSDYEKLKAENERLRKAGDAMYQFFLWVEKNKSEAVEEAMDEWEAAKEGKQP